MFMVIDISKQTHVEHFKCEPNTALVGINCYRQGELSIFNTFSPFCTGKISVFPLFELNNNVEFSNISTKNCIEIIQDIKYMVNNSKIFSQY